MKRSLGPKYWQRPAQPVDKPLKPKGFKPLSEGPAIQPTVRAASAPPPIGEGDRAPRADQVKPYGRGSIDAAVLAAQGGPQECADHIRKRARASNSHGPHTSRERTSETVAIAAGYPAPFVLTPDIVYTVMGALDKAGYRSAELYLEVAKQRHIAEGEPWTAQLALAAKLAKRACQRGRGPAKQAQPLPLQAVAALADKREPLAPGGPEFAVRATLLASWWLLREIEASHASLDHIEVDHDEKLVKWRLPSSKADWRALGATRTHTCACTEHEVSLKASLAAARTELNAILSASQEAKVATTTLSQQPVTAFLDCEAAAEIEPATPSLEPNDRVYVVNRSHRGKAEPGEATAAPSEVKPPLKEPLPPLDEAENLRTGDTGDANGIKSLDTAPVSSVETTKDGTQGSVPVPPVEAPRSKAREKLAYLLGK
eukprot:s1262_g4.t1